MSVGNSTPDGNSSSADSSTSTDNSSEPHSRWLPPEESWSDADDWPSEASDPGTPLLSVGCHSFSNKQQHGSCNCDVCSYKRHRSTMMWAVVLVWAVPLALAAGSAGGWWGRTRHPTGEQPRGQLLLAQVVFRHGARTPLSNLYWPNTTWTHCSQQPLNASAAAAAIPHILLDSRSRSTGGRVAASRVSSSSSGDSSSSNTSVGIQLQLYDPSGAPTPPELSGDDEPQLPGGCRMGSLTDTGYQNALDLGVYLRSHYIHQHKLLPAHKIDANLLHVESTAVQRTVTTLRGVLGGLYPNTSGTVRVAVRSPEDEVMWADWYGCPLLANLTAQLTDAQAAQDSHDPRLPEFERQVRPALQLPADAPLLWNRLMDELACLQAEGLTPPAVAAQQQLVRRIDYVTTQRRVEVSAPKQGDCLLGREHQQQCKQVTSLSTGRLLHLLLQNMAAAAHGSKGDRSSSQQLYAGQGLNAEDLQLLRAATARRLLRPAVADPASSTASSTGRGTRSTVPEEQQQQQPKLRLFSAHDTTLLPLLTALGQHQGNWPNFTSHLAFELWVHKGKHYVRVLHEGQPLRLPLAAPPAAAAAAAVAAVATAAAEKGDGQLQGHRHMPGGGGHVAAGVSVGPVAAGGVAGRVAGGPADGMGPSQQLQGFFARVKSNASQVKGMFVARGEAVVRAVSGLFGVHCRRELTLVQGPAGIVEQAAYDSTAFVVSLGDFEHRVVQDFVMAPDDYVTACGGSGVEPGQQAGRS